ncbi:MAG: tyrosine/phenylalanine carboxypeptidase domain-containing protein [Myxococcota bacterium]
MTLVAPPWTEAVDEALDWAQRRILLLASVTPENFGDCVTRLTRRLGGGGQQHQPRYRPTLLEDPRPLLDRVDDALSSMSDPLAVLYRERTHELHLEATLARTAGKPTFGEVAARRFAANGEVEPLVDSWLREPDAAWDTAAPVQSDDASSPKSLLSRLRAEVGRRRLPYRVEVVPGLASFAATGADAVYVAPDVPLTPVASHRTAVHEVEGHVMPRCRARGGPGLLRIGTARGSDTQEGWALVVEDRHGWLRGLRRRELARRHRAATTMMSGANAVETARTLVGLGCEIESAARITLRVFRGAGTTGRGLGREVAYLPAYMSVRAELTRAPELEAVITAGQVSIVASAALRPYLV